MNSERTIQLLGEAVFRRLQSTPLVLFGVGGVGGWCAEALVRSGAQQLVIVDFDTVSSSNINRQVVATSQNIGCSKVQQMREYLLLLNPEATIYAIDARYEQGDINAFLQAHQVPEVPDSAIIIDAIDSLDNKIQLLHFATAAGYRVFSSMGAGRRTDLQSIRVGEWKKVSGCPLARSLRKKMKEQLLFPMGKIQCVWSDGAIESERGTLCTMVGAFGLQLANIVIQTIRDEAN